ncbi:MAG: hypothetical protein KKH98_00710 [Spirochaetes bacterium]|nr:hypothetical protein [Spirochaetota bacterium]
MNITFKIRSYKYGIKNFLLFPEGSGVSIPVIKAESKQTHDLIAVIRYNIKV